jgi:primosomal protein N' (replication factor Y) (superfamily II helicase)
MIEPMKPPLLEQMGLWPDSPPTASHHAAQFAEILLDLDAKTLGEKTFTYAIPDEWQDSIQVGTPVLVSFGKQQDVVGFVVNIKPAYVAPFKIKPILEILDDEPLFDTAYLSFLQWIGDYYGTPLNQVIQCALPAALWERPKKKVCLTAEPFPHILELAHVSRDAQRLLMFLKERGQDYTPQFLASQCKLTTKKLQQCLTELKKRGWIAIETERGAASGQRFKTIRTVCLSETQPSPSNTPLTHRQQQILDYLKEHQATENKTIPLKLLLESLRTTDATVQKLALSGYLEVQEEKVRRDPLLAYTHLEPRREFVLSEAQQLAVDTVWACSDHPDIPHLLFGVTGSGKTEVYLTLTEKILAEGKSVLMLVPEIALTSQIARRFIERFGLEQIALWHSGLSAGEKADTWRRLQTGELRVMIGARSAIFTPIQHLGMIILDEEHDNSFKQDTPAPRYATKTLAQELAHRTGAKLLLGSATPDPVSYRQATANQRLLTMPSRFGGRAMAAVELIDMKKEKANGSQGILSRSLSEGLVETLEKQEQSIILINRRGFYTLVLCTTCEYLFTCPHCTVALTVHRSKQLVRCHYCGHEDHIPVFCTQCASSELILTGTGSQRVEEEILQLVPEARVIRLDSDTLKKKDGYREVFESFAAGDADILVGTQMVAKGLDVANVTLVGVINADSTFFLPDFKSSERGFQLLTQVAGRAGRGEKPGRAFIQCQDPNHPVIQFAKQQDYLGFYEYEIQARQEMQFPPFGQLIRFIVSGEDEALTLQFIKSAAHALKDLIHLPDEESVSQTIELMGPAPCMIERIQGRYRFHLLIKNHRGRDGQDLITRFYRKAIVPEGIHFLIDVDPQSLL